MTSRTPRAYCATQSVKLRGLPSQSVGVVEPSARVPATRTATRTAHTYWATQSV